MAARARMSKAAAARSEESQASSSSAGVQSCIFCEATFDDKSALQEHFRTHGEPKKSIKLNKPIERKNGKILIKCDFCEEGLESVSLAIQHQFRKHKDLENKYFCPWCGKRFPISYTYNEHMRLHIKDDLQTKKECLQCTVCNFVFYTSEALKIHHSSVHTVQRLFRKSSLVPPPSKKIYVDHVGDMQSVYYCQCCGKEYILKFNLQSHIEKIHSKEIIDTPAELIQCKLCDAFFYSEKAYEYHNTYHTPSDVYVANEDMRAHIVTKVDQEFDEKRVKPRAKIRRNTSQLYPLNKQNSVVTNDMSELSPPPSDSSDSEPEILDKKCKQEETNDPTRKEHLNVKPVVDAECSNVQSSKSKSTIQNLEVKYMTKEEMDKLKSKGLLRLASKPTDFKNVKKIQIVANPPQSINEDSDTPELKHENIVVNKGGGVIKTFYNRKRKVPDL